jgi:hypothetical protein
MSDKEITMTTFGKNIAANIRSTARKYADLPTLDLSPTESSAERALIRSFLYYLMPTWIVSGIVDWYWHKQTDIEHTAGPKESVIHLLQFTQLGIAILFGLVCKINAGSLLAMWTTAFVHWFTGFWDVDVAVQYREVAPREQHTHGFLDVIPFTACAIASCLHWSQFRAMFGLGPQKPDYNVRLKDYKIPDSYWPVLGVMIGAVAAVYGNEMYRSWRARNERHYNTGCYKPEK